MTGSSLGRTSRAPLTPAVDKRLLNRGGAHGADGARDAIAMIEVVTAGSRGTGVLITPDIVLTALHVVAERRQVGPRLYSGEIRVTCPHRETTASIIDGAFDSKNDWVMLKCRDVVTASPMKLASLRGNTRTWVSFGFPDADAEDGLTFRGTVVDHKANLDGVRAHQLFSPQAAAGMGARVSGLSGAPVIIDGYVVGVMRYALMEGGRAELGTIYACPVEAIDTAKAGLPRPRDLPPHRRIPHVAIVAISVIVGAMVFGAAQMRVGQTSLSADMRIKDATFTLTKAQALQQTGALVRARFVRPSGIQGVTLPPELGQDARVAAEAAVFSVVAVAGRTGELALDLTHPLPEGAQVRVRRTESIPDEYSIELSRHLSPISLAVTAPVDVDFDGAPPRHIRQPDGPYATIDPQPGYGAGEFKPMELGITLLPNDTVKVDRAIAVDSVSVTQPLISEPKETVPGSVTIDTAMIWVGGSHEPRILPSGAPLRWHFIHGTAAVDRIALSKGNMTIRLHGIVDSLSLKDTAGGATDLMPNWYAELGVAKVTTLAIIVGGLTALLLLRLARPQFAFTSRDE